MKQVQHIQALFGLAGLAKPKKPSRNGAHQPSFLSALFQGLCASFNFCPAQNASTVNILNRVFLCYMLCNMYS